MGLIMQKFYPQQKFWIWNRVITLLLGALFLLYVSIEALHAYLTGRFFDQSILVILSPIGALAGLLISFYFLYQYFMTPKKKPGLVLDQKGILIPLENPLFIPWNKLLKVDKRDFRRKFPVPVTRKDYIYILYNNSKKSAVWLPPSVYGLSANDLEKEINTFWKTSKSNL